MIKRLAALIMFVTFISTPALAGMRPEFDAVGDDSTNLFNDAVHGLVLLDPVGAAINTASDFCNEDFVSNGAKTLFPSYCFGDLDPTYQEYLLGQNADGYYEWTIVLQMKPQSDLNLKIRDCVLIHNEDDIWMSAQQTGRYTTAGGTLKFKKNRNPRVTVIAYPGPKHSSLDPFIMTARRMPTLGTTVLEEALYTSKAFWNEGIVVKLPEAGYMNSSLNFDYSSEEFALREGDSVKVRVDVKNSAVDMYYGADNVVIEYIGTVGYYMTDDQIVCLPTP